MESFDLFFGLHLAFRIFSAAEQLSVNLQAKDMTVAEGSKGAELLQRHYKSQWSLESFGNLYDQVLRSANGITEEPVLPQFRKRPRRLEDGSTPHRYSSAEDMHRQAFFEFLDLVADEVERRFDQADLCVVRELESLLISVANGDGKGAVQIGRSVVEYLQEHVDINRLQTQLVMLPDTIRTTFKDPPAPKR